MLIEKQARSGEQSRRTFASFPSARAAFAAFLRAVAPSGDGAVLLPAYVGWSAREGSGVFDPVTELRLPHAFYRVDRRLRIDLDHLEQVLRTERVRALVLIHYFGYVDPCYRQAAALAREHGAVVLEDEAHALLTDLVGGESGWVGDACLFSLHKMLPVGSGGLLVVNPSAGQALRDIGPAGGEVRQPWEYDLAAFAARRRENAAHLHRLLAPLAAHVEPLWGPPGPGVVPQTFPVLVRKTSRDRVYHELNEAGFGVVSLYHTMIESITDREFPDSHQLAKTVLNLPVHQDVAPGALEALVDRLGRVLEGRS